MSWLGNFPVLAGLSHVSVVGGWLGHGWFMMTWLGMGWMLRTSNADSPHSAG